MANRFDVKKSKSLRVVRWALTGLFGLIVAPTFGALFAANVEKVAEQKHWNEYLTKVLGIVPDIPPWLNSLWFWIPVTVLGTATALLWGAQWWLEWFFPVSSSDLEIRFDPGDKKCVQIRQNLYGPAGEFYSVWLENTGSKTLEKVSLRALESWFTQMALSEATTGHSARYQKPLPIFEADELHPSAPEKIELFGLSYATDSTNKDYIYNSVQQFTLEARAKDTQTVRKMFEYDPVRRPMVRVVDLKSYLKKKYLI